MAEPAAGQPSRPPCTLTRLMAGRTRSWLGAIPIAALALLSQLDRRRQRGCERHRFADIRLRRVQAGRRLYLHSQGFVLRVSQRGVVVLREHPELGAQPSPVRDRHQLHELYAVDSAAQWRRPRLIHGVRHGYRSEFNTCVRDLHDQVANPFTRSEP